MEHGYASRRNFGRKTYVLWEVLSDRDAAYRLAASIRSRNMPARVAKDRWEDYYAVYIIHVR